MRSWPRPPLQTLVVGAAVAVFPLRDSAMQSKRSASWGGGRGRPPLRSPLGETFRRGEKVSWRLKLDDKRGSHLSILTVEIFPSLCLVFTIPFQDFALLFCLLLAFAVRTVARPLLLLPLGDFGARSLARSPTRSDGFSPCKSSVNFSYAGVGGSRPLDRSAPVRRRAENSLLSLATEQMAASVVRPPQGSAGVHFTLA